MRKIRKIKIQIKVRHKKKTGGEIRISSLNNMVMQETIFLLFSKLQSK